MAFSFYSCEEKELPAAAPEVEAEITFSEGQKDAETVSQAAETATVNFKSTKNWTAIVKEAEAATWCSISPSEGDEGDNSITIEIAANETPDERVATIIIASDNVKKEIKFTQKQKDALTLTSKEITIGVDGGEFEIEVLANIKFDIEIETAATWIKQADTKALSPTVLTFTAEANTDTKGREATIVIKNGDLSETFTVTQKQLDAFSVTGQPTEPFTSAGGEFDITVSENTGTPTVEIAESAQSWIEYTIAPSTRALKETVITFTVKANATFDERSGEITIKSGDSEPKTFIVTQSQKDELSVTGAPTEPIASAGDVFEITVSENIGTPTVEIKEADKVWIKAELIPASKALDMTKFKITIEANTTTDNRSSEITIKSGNKSKPLSVTQMGLEIIEPKPLKFGDLLIYDRNLGTEVPQTGVALNYTNDEDHPDNANATFKGDYYTLEKALTACPVDWRLPTKDEFELISKAMQYSDGQAYLT